MKKYITKPFLFLALFLSFSCIEEDLDSLNRDSKNATTAAAGTFFSSAQKELADIMGAVLYRATGPGVTRMWVQHLTSVTYLEGATYIPETSWAPLYRDVLKDLDESAMILRDSEPSLEEEIIQQQNQLAMIEILTVFTYATLVEAYGDIPYSEALDFSNPTPKFDDAQTVYTNLLNRLSAAISNLNTAGKGFESADLIYEGDIGRWTKFGNSLKLRMGMRIIDAVPEVGAQAVSEAIPGVITSNDENAKFVYLEEYPNTHPWWSFLVRQNLKYYVGTTSFIGTMNELNDPRRNVFFTPVEGEFKGAPYGIVSRYDSSSREGEYFRNPALPVIFMDLAQVEFLLAEAAERGIGPVSDPGTHYNKAITASFEYYGLEDEVELYLQQPEVNYSSATGTWQRKIAMQKWIALFDQGFEAWTEYRRLDYPELNAPDIAESDIVPRRFLYPIEEQTINGENYQAAASAIGGDSYTTRLFWDTE